MTSDPIARFQAQRGARGGAVSRMASSEVIDAALRVYQRQGLTFLRLTALPSLFCLAAVAFVLSYVVPGFATTKDASNIATQAGEVVLTLFMAVFVAGPVFLTGLTYGSAIVVRMTSDILEGRRPDEFEALKSARAALPRLFWLNLRELLLSLGPILLSTAFMLLGSFLTTVTSNDNASAGLVALIGILGLCVGGVVFLAVISRHALALPVAVIENRTGKLSAKRSLELLKNAPSHGSAFGTIHSVYFLLFFVGIVLYIGLFFGVTLTSAEERLNAWFAGSWLKPFLIEAVGLLPVYLVLWIVIPIWAATLTVVYYERRVRLEGYDIEALASQTNEDRASRFNV